MYGKQKSPEFIACMTRDRWGANNPSSPGGSLSPRNVWGEDGVQKSEETLAPAAGPKLPLRDANLFGFCYTQKSYMIISPRTPKGSGLEPCWGTGAAARPPGIFFFFRIVT
jgi:hypothetical protein